MAESQVREDDEIFLWWKKLKKGEFE